jgi:hypothetical protein
MELFLVFMAVAILILAYGAFMWWRGYCYAKDKFKPKYQTSAEIDKEYRKVRF